MSSPPMGGAADALSRAWLMRSNCSPRGDQAGSPICTRPRVLIKAKRT